MFDDVTSSALRVGLTGLAQRQRVTADNIANIETPGFLAGRVKFEEALKASLSDGRSAVSQTSPSTLRSLEPTRTNGNNVNLDHETLTQMDTGLRYQTLLRALDSKYGLLRESMKTGV